MKILIWFALLISGTFSMAEVPFTKDAFEKAQKNNEKIILVFHAEWCSSCRSQHKSLSRLEQSGFLKGITYFQADYDKEEDLKKSLNVNNQSTLITFYGTYETSRSVYLTKEEQLKNDLEKNLITLTLKDQLNLIKKPGK